MANAKKLSIAELKTDVNTWVAKSKIAQTSYTTIISAIDGLLEKIGKIYTNEQTFQDKLTMLDGEFLSFGRQVEEWERDQILPTDYDDVDEVADLKSAFPTYRPATYSYPLGDKVFSVTRSYKDLQSTVHNEGQLAELIMDIQNALTNAKMIYRYAAKRQMIGRLVEMCKDEMDANKAVAWAAGTARAVNTIVKNTSSNPTHIGIVVKDYPASANLTYDNAVAQGYVINLDLITTIAKPTDTATGEAFIKQLKADVEIASDISEGHSLNGNTLGAVQGKILFVKQGLVPTLEVDVQAGAFNGEKVAAPSEIIVLPDFGKDADPNVYAVLTDSRTLRLFPNFDYSGVAENKSKAWAKFVAHLDATAHISRNTFVKVYKNA